jgi:hypothetical protein
MWGDGFYIGGGVNLNLSRCVSDRNRRQGMSIIACKNLYVADSIFSNTSGTPPSAGIDIEPDKGCVIEGVNVLNCKLFGNAGAGLEYAPKRGTVKHIRVGPSNQIWGNKYPIKDNTLGWWDKLMFELGWYNPTTLVIP